MRFRLLLLVVLSLVLSSCSSLNVAPTPTATTALPTVAPEPTATTESSPVPTEEAEPLPTVTANLSPTVSADEIEQELVQIEGDTAKLRGLTPKQDVKEHIVPASEIQTNLTNLIKEEYTPTEAKEDATWLWLLRLVPDRNINLQQLQIDLLGEQVVGYYDHKKKELFVRQGQGDLTPLAKETLAHEFVHSLQDQYYDLNKLRPDDIDNDRGTAVLSLIEGDAQASGFSYAQKYFSSDEMQQLLTDAGGSSSQVLDRAPAYVRESLLFPYTQGVLFITSLARSQPGSFAAVDAALQDPPVSTEQILHTEKYLGAKRDNPLPVNMVPLTDTLGAGWTQTDDDSLGEFDLRMMLSENGVDDQDAAAGWGGGHYALYRNGESVVVLMDTLWDTAQDATEFGDALQLSLKSARKNGNLWSDGTRYFGIARGTSQVVFVSGTDQATVEKALVAAKP